MRRLYRKQRSDDPPSLRLTFAHALGDRVAVERNRFHRASGEPEPAPDSKPALPARFTRKPSGWK